MHGLGDNLHQRGILRQLMQRYDVTLESSWVAPYHDLIKDGLKVVNKPTSLRTQAKNAKREARLFHKRQPVATRTRKVWYSPQEVRANRGVLSAMCRNCDVSYERADFRLPVPAEWVAAARAAVPTDRPILVYRPLVERTEWKGCAARNPDHDAYAALYASIRDKFHVVSIADLAPGKEWMVGHDAIANAQYAGAQYVDQRFHAGELPFETLAGLFSCAAMVFAAPGFAVILAQAVETPVAAVFGSYEASYSFSGGARFSPYLGIDPIIPCDDFNHSNTKDKTIDVAAATARLAVFASEAIERHYRRAEGGLERAA
jgi:ADP-heptose:LPS heptosyltransferase